MIHFPKEIKGISYLLGNPEEFEMVIHEPFSPIVCDFLKKVSNYLMHDDDAKNYTDVISFAYWCRHANIQRLSADFYSRKDGNIRLGRGLIFHITPSNVPINFAFSFAFSLLAGNTNVVRVPTKKFHQIQIIIRVLTHILKDKCFDTLKKSTFFVHYERSDEITAIFSENCNGRVIWGGEETIKKIRILPISDRAVEVVFADRYSLCVINADKLRSCDGITLTRLLSGFYNDTYLMDQNACSSPHLIIWLGECAYLEDSIKKFWSELHKFIEKKYKIAPIFAVEKLTELYKSVIKYNEISHVSQFGNQIYVFDLDRLPNKIDSLRGKFGHFYQYYASSLDEIIPHINESFQTLTYYGIEKDYLIDFISKSKVLGIDRVVPVGSALDISVVWDGYDLVSSLSRIVDVK